ncbi:MAG: DMT family transporter [Candidatus Pacebacteria bacterium]|nr:DMT family transporter [Candidatus Paceibacterota bacterium]
MSERAILLVLLSACLHAAWNLFSKSSDAPVAFLLRALRFSALFYAPLFLWMQFRVAYSPLLIACLTGSGVCTGLYFFCLGKAYHHGKVSVAYPVARSFPILVITFGALFLGEVPSPRGAMGVVLVVSGCFILPWQRFVCGPEGFCLENYHNRSVLWALAAALFTACFSLLDKVAALAMRDIGESMVDKVNYVYLQNAIAWATIAICIRIARYKVYPVARWRAYVCGAIFLASYSLILMALATDPVAYVVSFRQISIVIATLISMLWLERQFTWPRMTGVGLIFSGVLLIGWT